VAVLCRRDADFVAELNSRRWSLRNATEERLLGLRKRGIEAMERLLESEDHRVQFQAAQLVLGLKLREQIGPTSREGVETMWRRSAVRKVEQDRIADQYATMGV
jgi:hypothetical protein